MKNEEKMESFYYTDRKLTNKIDEIYLTQPPLLPYDYDKLEKDVNDFILKHNLLPGRVSP